MIAKKRFLPLIIIAVLAGLAGFGVVRVALSRSAAASPCEADICVSLAASGAEPDVIALPVGQYVQFNSEDGKTHSLSLGAGGSEHSHSGPFSSGEFGADEAWKVQFKETGTFQFHDHFNPDLNVLVVVYEKDGDHTIR